MNTKPIPWTLVYLLLGLSATAPLAATGAPTTTVRIESVSGRMEGYLTRSPREGRHPGLVLVQGPGAAEDELLSLSARFAEPGFTVLAIRLPPVPLDESGRSTEAVFARVKSAVDYLADQEAVDGERLAAVWWGFGSGWPEGMTPGMLRVEAVAVAMGGGPSTEDITRMRSKIFERYGGGDLTVTMDSGRHFQAVVGSGEEESAIYLLTTGIPNPGGEGDQEAMSRIARFLEGRLGGEEAGSATENLSKRHRDRATKTPVLLYLLASFAAANR